MTPLVSSLVAGAVRSQRLPGPTYESPTEGSPGFAGFVATFLLALAVIALGVSFTRRMRRASHRDRLRVEPPDPAVAGGAEGAAPTDGAAPPDPVADPHAPGPAPDGEPR